MHSGFVHFELCAVVSNKNCYARSKFRPAGSSFGMTLFFDLWTALDLRSYRTGFVRFDGSALLSSRKRQNMAVSSDT